MKLNRNVFGVFAAAVLSLSMFAGAAAQEVDTTAELGFAACSLAIGDSQTHFDMVWNGATGVYEQQEPAFVEVILDGEDYRAGFGWPLPFCDVEVALAGGGLFQFGFGFIAQSWMTGSVPNQPGDGLADQFVLQSYMTHTVELDMDGLPGGPLFPFHAPGEYGGTLDFTITSGV